jgi:hypothetical protein
MKGFLDMLNQQMDPVHHSFRIETTFDFTPRPTAPSTGGIRVEDFTTVVHPEGQFAVFDFDAALPRAKLYSQWQTATNDITALETLADPAFDPQQSVLVASPIAQPANAAAQTTGTVSIVRYEPNRVTMNADAATACVLLLNDKFDPSWKVTVDGKPDRLLRCNYIMRGVSLPAGRHQVEFSFDPPHGALYVTLAALAASLVLCGILAFTPTRLSPATGELVAAPIANLKSKI